MNALTAHVRQAAARTAIADTLPAVSGWCSPSEGGPFFRKFSVYSTEDGPRVLMGTILVFAGGRTEVRPTAVAPEWARFEMGRAAFAASEAMEKAAPDPAHRKNVWGGPLDTDVGHGCPF